MGLQRSEDTRDGVRLTFELQENAKFLGLVATGADALPQRLIEIAFTDQFGKTLNRHKFYKSLQRLQVSACVHACVRACVCVCVCVGVGVWVCGWAGVGTCVHAREPLWH